MPHIVIPATVPRIQYIADGAQTGFPFPYPFFDYADVKVFVDDVLQVLGYTISGTTVDGGYSAGTVTFGTAPANGAVIDLVRDIEVKRLGDFPYPSPTLDIRTLNTEFDRLTATIQDWRRLLNLTIRYPVNEAEATLLPPASERAGHFLAFDGDGNVIAAVGGGGSGPIVSAFVETLLDDANSSTFLTTLKLLQAGAGAVPHSVLDKLRERVSVLDYGAVGDGSTDDTAAFTAALNSFGTAGGALEVPAGKRYRIASDITIPSNVVLVGPQRRVEIPHNNLSAPYGNITPAILLGSSAEIHMKGGSGLVGLLIYPYGMTFPQPNSSAWTGTAIVPEEDGITISGCMILGFNAGITADGPSRGTVVDCAIDCVVGISWRNSFDSTRFHRVHIWPFATIEAFAASFTPGPADYTIIQRAGAGILLRNGSDGTSLQDVLIIDHLYGLVLDGAGGLIGDNIWIDGSQHYTGSIGLWYLNGTNTARLNTVNIWGTDKAVEYDANGAFNFIETLNLGFIPNLGVNAVRGVLRVNSYNARAVQGVLGQIAGAALLSFGHIDARACPATVLFSATAPAGPAVVMESISSDRANGAGITDNMTIETLPVALTFNVPSDSKVIGAGAGAAGIKSVLATHPQRDLFLVASTSFTLYDFAGAGNPGGNLLLGGTDISMSSGKCVHLVCIGTSWVKVS